MVGPSGSNDGYLMVFDGTSGLLVQEGIGPPGTGAYLNVGQTTGTLAAGDDPRFGGLTSSATRMGLEIVAKKTGQGHYDLGEVYGLDHINGSMKLNELYTLLGAQNKFDKLFEWYTSPAGGTQSDAWVMSLYHGVACHNEAIIQGNVGTLTSGSLIGSNNTIHWPRGIYLINEVCWYDQNKIRGRGTNTAFIGADNTVLAFDRASWQGTTGFERGIFWPSQYAQTSGSSWNEGVDIDNFRLEGGMSHAYYDNSSEECGIRTWDQGECARIGKIYAIGFNGCGIKLERGTPTYVDLVSVFSNCLGGIGIYGGSLGTTRINVVSGDDNPSLIRIRDGQVVDHTRDGGGNISIGLMKSESGKRIPYRGQILVDAGESASDGVSMNLSIDTAWAAVDNRYLDALFVVKGRQAYGNISRITVNQISGYNYSSLLHDVSNGKRWSSPGDYGYIGFTWNGGGGGNLAYNSTVDNAYPYFQGTVSSPQRLGLQGVPGGGQGPALIDLADLPSATASQNENYYIDTDDDTLGTFPIGASVWSVFNGSNWEWQNLGRYNYKAGYPQYFIDGGALPDETPNTTRMNPHAGMVPSIISSGATAQGYGRLLGQNLQPITSGVVLSWFIQSGPATIDEPSGVLTAGTVSVDTTVVVRCFFATHLIDFSVTITP